MDCIRSVLVVYASLCCLTHTTQGQNNEFTNSFETDGDMEGECAVNIDCGPDMVCKVGKCVDPCKHACGANTSCKVINQLTVCACKPSFSGDPFKSCYPDLPGRCSEHKDCDDDKACNSGACVDPCQGACGAVPGACQVREHVPKCLLPNGVKKVNTPDIAFKYTYLNAPRNSLLRFKVKARNDAHVMLSEVTDPVGSAPFIEIVIGGWGNSKSVIRDDRDKPVRTEAQTPEFLSNQELRSFWVTYAGGNIAVGRDNQIKPFLSWTTPTPFNVKAVGVATGFGSTGEWIIYGVSDNTTEGSIAQRISETQQPALSPLGNGHKVNTPDVAFAYSYFPAPRSDILRFKVKAGNDAHVMLSEVPDPVGSAPFIEIVIGGWGNSKSVIRDDRDQPVRTEAETPNFLSNEELRSFWVKYDGGNVAVGRDDQVSPFMSWTLLIPLKVKFVGVATGFGSTGEWIIYGLDDESPQEPSQIAQPQPLVPHPVSRGNAHQVNTPDVAFAYSYFAAPHNSLLRFKVKAGNDAHVMLSELADPAGSAPFVEIVIGGWGNSKSVIRDDRDKPVRTEAQTPNFLSNQELRSFWVTYAGGNIAVGRDNQVNPFMSWTNPTPFKVKLVGVATGFGSTGEWIIYGVRNATTDSSRIASQPISSVSSQKVNTPDVSFEYTYLPAPRNTLVRFKVRASNDAHVMLSEVTDPVGSAPFVEIVLGGWGNSKSVIRDDRDQPVRTEAHTSNMLNNQELRSFWVTYADGNIAVGRDNQIKPFLTWTSQTPLNVKFVGFATGFGSTGEWIIYGSL